MRSVTFLLKYNFYTADANRIPSMLETMEKVTERFPDCVLDITGGQHTMLYAAGGFLQQPYYSSYGIRKNQRKNF